MIEDGYILQPRRFDRSEASEFPPHVREIWLFLLRRANHRDADVKGTLIKRGQMVITYKEIIESLKWRVGYRVEKYKKHHCESAIKILKRTGMITTSKTTRGMRITISNYDHYQNPRNYVSDSESDNKATRSRRLIDTINNNDKKIKNEKNSPLMSELASDLSEDATQVEKLTVSFYKLFNRNMDLLNVKPTVLKAAKAAPWLNAMRLILEADKRTLAEINEVYNHIKEDEFWQANCRSVPALRAKFEQILIRSRQMKRQTDTKQKSQPIPLSHKPFKFQ